ncbi:zf-PARP-domain-containing protein [Westerdykella ornata]|uniref:Zf-PARP-domain-containing protein n=1 Tax=Westerdykella ornata TaxID=318751 RepID=A0A6A6JD02_WESOR|nr:zf-PARP-domain-containing protein [Westerdykella ornata]KAF2274147.1 zf-PARP-domain-containing protein [Westerdykella ornata]
MPTGYRIELSPNARAMCKNKECKDAGVKIQKGELRFGTLVTIEEHTSWTYKHWGCVTPEQIKNVQSFIDGDMDLLEGYEELPQEEKDKVDFAIKNGHVPDEDWKGDIEKNRPGMKGFRVNAPRKKKGTRKDKEEGEQEEEEEETGKPQKKRGRPAKDEGEAEAPAAKKRGRPAKETGRKKATKKEETSDGGYGQDLVEETAAPPKKARGKKAAAPKMESDDEADRPEPKKPRGRKAAAKEKDNQEAESKPSKARGRKPAAKASYAEEATDEEEQEELGIAKPKRGRKKTAA